MTLILNGTDNSVSAPAVQGGTAGTTTGIYYPTTNQVAIATNGTQAMLVDSSQNVTMTGSLTTASATGSLNSINTFGFKNRLINGAMVIDQRNAGASVTPTDGQYTLDRWQALQAVASKFSVQQNAASVTPPAGFANYLGATSLSAYSVAAGDYFAIGQLFEGYNTADLGWGTANAKAVTLSFQVYSSLTGTFGGVIKQASNTRSYPFTYTISSANTWTSISITILGDTSGTYATGNTSSIKMYFGLGVGSTYSGTAGSWSGGNYISATGATSVVGTSGATFYVTGVQLEKGSQATSFDFRNYAQEFAYCQRYYAQLVGNYSPDFSCPNSSYVNYFTFAWRYPQVMRATPTISQISGTTVAMDQYGIGPATVTGNSIGSVNQYYGRITVVTSSPSSVAPGTAISPTGTFWQASAEL
jgi:hypothetical protein